MANLLTAQLLAFPYPPVAILWKALGDEEAETFKLRKKVIDATIETIEGSPVIVSKRNPWYDASIRTWLLPPTDRCPNWHIRIHHVITARSLSAAEGAWAVHGDLDVKGSRMKSLDLGIEGNSHALRVSRSGVVGIVELLVELVVKGNC